MIAGPLDVLNGQCIKDLIMVLSLAQKPRDGLIILFAPRDGFLKDRGVGRHATQIIFSDQLGELSIRHELPGDKIKPDALAGFFQFA